MTSPRRSRRNTSTRTVPAEDQLTAASGDHEQGQGLMHFETADDALAAFLVLRGCRRIGLGTGPGGEVSPTVAHVFDDDAAKLVTALGAHDSGRGDDVSVTKFIAEYGRLQDLRLGQDLRLRRQTQSDIAKVREGDAG